MAFNFGAIATEAPLSTRRTQTPPSDFLTDDVARQPKRRRESDSTTSRSFAAEQLLSLEPPTKSARLSLVTNQSLPQLIDAVALEEERLRREEELSLSPCTIGDNPNHRALIYLMSGGIQTMSRSSDAPQLAPTAAMEPSSKLANAALSIPHNSDDHGEDHSEMSPQSPTSIAGAPVTESPTAMDVDDKGDELVSQHVAMQDERPQPGSLSYPGSLQSSGNLTEPPARGMSFPMPSQNQGSPSSGKKHKCPYCNTEFTRHHNLKSHLLTHSQEKPFVCTECQMRFRRLHDLKRHGKLHTGEKPHVCPKCDRKFARGDALARHSKGAGGCAGRRSSMGSFADGDDMDGGIGDGDESAMAGIAYDNGEEEEMRRQSLPGLNTQHMPSGQGDQYGAHARTYPPTGVRAATSGLYAPNVNQTQVSGASNSSVPNSMAGSHTSSTSISSVPVGSGGTGIYSQAGMTENAKQLSPGLQGHETPGIARQRSPSLTQQLQQQMGRRQSELQSPHSGQARPKLPGLSHPPFAASNSTGFSHARTPSGTTPSGDSGNMFAQSDPSVWAYMQTLEEKIKSLSEKVVSLDQEVAMLKKQLENREGVAAV